VEQPDDIIRIFIPGRVPCQRTETCLTIAELPNEVKDFRRHVGPLALQSLRAVVEGAASLIQRERVLHKFGAGTLLGKRPRLDVSGIRERVHEDVRNKFAQDSIGQHKGHSIREIFRQFPSRAA